MAESVNMGIISLGGPGSMMTSLPFPSMARPGAVPWLFWNTVQPSGTSACLRVLGVSSMPRLA